MPVDPFRDLRDPDERRREILWIAISFIVILASWLAVVLIFGYPPLVLGMTYDETVLVVGLGLLLLCSVLYLVAVHQPASAGQAAGHGHHSGPARRSA